MHNRDVILSQEYLAFILLNLFDLLLTGYIFSHEGLEANGLAALIYTRFGPAGFVFYKFGLVSIVVGACEAIAVQNLRTARIIVLGGCILYLFVVFWESAQIFQHISWPSLGLLCPGAASYKITLVN